MSHNRLTECATSTGVPGKASYTPRGWRVLPALAVAGSVAAVAFATTHTPGTAVAQEQGNTVVTPFPGAPASFADLVERVKGAVVSIHVTNDVKTTTGPAGAFPSLPDGHPLQEFFKRFGGEQNPGRRGRGRGPNRPSLAQGSGFIISPDGYIRSEEHTI